MKEGGCRCRGSTQSATLLTLLSDEQMSCFAVSAEWSRCPGSMARRPRDSVVPLRRSSAGWMPARIERLSAGLGRRHPVTIRKASLMAGSMRRVWALRHQTGAQNSKKNSVKRKKKKTYGAERQQWHFYKCELTHAIVKFSHCYRRPINSASTSTQKMLQKFNVIRRSSDWHMGIDIRVVQNSQS